MDPIRKIFRNKDNDTDSEALKNFKNYIEDINNVVDERLVWDLFSYYDIVFKPINIIIITADIVNRKLIKPKWLCPIGYDIEKMFDPSDQLQFFLKYMKMCMK